MRKPDFTNLLSLLEANEDFSLTENQYLKSTGSSLPKSPYYLKQNSALAKFARRHGYALAVEENKRSVSFKKMKK